VVVAAFLVTMGLMTQVVRKTREIGLLAAMGGSARSVAAIYCFQGLFVGTLGTMVGLSAGFLILHYRDQIVQGLNWLFRNQQLFERVYQFTELPAHTETIELVLIITFALIASTLGGLIPAWRAAQLKPVEALRSE